MYIVNYHDRTFLVECGAKLNRIRIGQGRCNYLLYKWKIKAGPKYDCNADEKTIEHIISACVKRKFHDTLTETHAATDKVQE